MSKFWKSGDPFVWLTGGALAFSLLMVTGLMALILWSGLGFFWPKDMQLYALKDGSQVLGQFVFREPIPGSGKDGSFKYRIQVRQGNRDLYGADFVWIDESQIDSITRPPEAAFIERREWGNFHGYTTGLKLADGVRPFTADLLASELKKTADQLAQLRKLERGDVGRINAAQEKIRLRLKALKRDGVTAGVELETLNRDLAQLQGRYQNVLREINALRNGMTSALVLHAQGRPETELPLSQVVRVAHPNQMGKFQKARFYAAKVWEFVSDEPRESNTEGGVFPAIFGTVMMVIIMSVIVTPLGVLAAVYLREYARQGVFVSIVRIAVNNLAGVPSIVFGVFGVGFFIYFVGGSIDRLFYADALPTPTFGTGGILWASLTLALMTVPVVIVSTEEGLAAIPRGTREASLALGATKFETTWRVVLPAVTPSILTGLILAMARAAGEVAPLMITGVVKLAPTLAVDGDWPFVHLDRKFMHLGFHIFDVGFQSPNVDAARPMVFTTTILLILIIVSLNLAAIRIRARLRKKYAVTTL